MKTYVIMFKDNRMVRIAAERFLESSGTVKFLRNDEVIAIFLAEHTIGFYIENARVNDPAPM